MATSDRTSKVKFLLSSRNNDERQRDTGPLMQAVSRKRKGAFSGTGNTNKGMGSMSITGGHKAGHVSRGGEQLHSHTYSLVHPTSLSQYQPKTLKAPMYSGRTGGMSSPSPNQLHMSNGLSSNPQSASVTTRGQFSTSHGENKGEMMSGTSHKKRIPG